MTALKDWTSSALEPLTSVGLTDDGCRPQADVLQPHKLWPTGASISRTFLRTRCLSQDNIKTILGSKHRPQALSIFRNSANLLSKQHWISEFKKTQWVWPLTASCQAACRCRYPSYLGDIQCPVARKAGSFSHNTHSNTTTKSYSDSLFLISPSLTFPASTNFCFMCTIPSSLSQKEREENREKVVTGVEKVAIFLKAESHKRLKQEMQPLHNQFSWCISWVGIQHYLTDMNWLNETCWWCVWLCMFRCKNLFPPSWQTKARNLSLIKTTSHSSQQSSQKLNR